MEMLRASGYPLKSIYLGQTSMESEFVSRWCFTQASALQSIKSDINVDIYHIELGIDLNRSAQVDLMLRDRRG